MVLLYIKNAIDRYVNDRIMPGGFLYAVLTNNLFEAIGRADCHSLDNLVDICSYICNEIPSVCWGSAEKVDNWLNGRVGG